MWPWILRLPSTGGQHAKEQKPVHRVELVSKSSRRKNVTPTISSSLTSYFFVLILGAFAYPQAQDQQKGPTIKVKSELVNLEVVVTDSGGQRVTGLQKEDFGVYEDGVKQDITHFSTEPRLLKVLLLFDLSTSMEAALRSVQQITTKLVDSLHAEDEVMVVTFAKEITATSDWTKDKNNARLQILQLVSAPPPWRNIPRSIDVTSLPDVNTNLYGGLRYVFDTTGREREHIVAFLFSDGIDSLDRYALKQRNLDAPELLKHAEESFAPIYPACFETQGKRHGFGRVGPLDISRRNPHGYGSNCKFLSTVAVASGGKMFRVQDAPTLEATLQQTLADLRSQYSLGYRPTSDRPGFHSIRVLMKRPNLLAQCRKGYRR